MIHPPNYASNRGFRVRFRVAKLLFGAVIGFLVAFLGIVAQTPRGGGIVQTLFTGPFDRIEKQLMAWGFPIGPKVEQPSGDTIADRKDSKDPDNRTEIDPNTIGASREKQQTKLANREPSRSAEPQEELSTESIPTVPAASKQGIDKKDNNQRYGSEEPIPNIPDPHKVRPYEESRSTNTAKNAIDDPR